MFAGIFKKIRICVLFIILFFPIYSCSGEKQAGLPSPSQTNEPDKKTQVSSNEGDVACIFQIKPEEPDKKTILKLSVQNLNLNAAKIEWHVNGNFYENATSYQLNPSQLNKGDNIQAIAIINDRRCASNTVRIKNTPPEITDFKITPETFKPGDKLGVDVNTKDADGDNISVVYEWTKNGEPAGTDKKILSSLKRGDKIEIKITVFDGQDYGVPIVSKISIDNFPPVIVEDKKFNFDGKIFSYQVKATDPDDDTLAYALKTAPAGMTIEKTTGLIKWIVPQDFIGKPDIAVVVSDGHGGESVYSFVFELTMAR